MGVWSTDVIFFFSLNEEKRKKSAKSFFISYILFGFFIVLIGLYLQSILIAFFSIFPFFFAFYVYSRYIRHQIK